MSAPKWQTPTGFLGTITERQTVSIQLATETTSVFSLISGELPTALSLSTSGSVTGIVDLVIKPRNEQFVIRATNTSGVTDRTFILDIQKLNLISWETPSGFISAGPGEDYYVINRNYVDFQFVAKPGIPFTLSTPASTGTTTLYLNTLTYVDVGSTGTWRNVEGFGIRQNTTITSINTSFDVINQGYAIGISSSTQTLVSGHITILDRLLDGQDYRYFIKNLNGQIPPGLTLEETGRLHGYVNDQLTIDTRVSSGGYDTDQYSGYPYDHGILINGEYIRFINRSIPKTYQFTVTAQDNFVEVDRNFKMLVVDPSNLRADTDLNDSTGPLSAVSGYIVPVQWLDLPWQGFTNTTKIVY